MKKRKTLLVVNSKNELLFKTRSEKLTSFLKPDSSKYLKEIGETTSSKSDNSEKNRFARFLEMCRQNSEGHPVDPESTMGPIVSGETLEPALRGLKKLESDPNYSLLLKNIYRGKF